MTWESGQSLQVESEAVSRRDDDDGEEEEGGEGLESCAADPDVGADGADSWTTTTGSRGSEQLAGEQLGGEDDDGEAADIATAGTGHRDTGSSGDDDEEEERIRCAGVASSS